MSDINVLIVVDGIFALTTTYPIDPTKPPFGPEADPTYGADAWFTLSHLINTLRNSPSPTFTVDTASRGFNAAGNFPGAITNAVADPDATLSGPFHFDDPSVDLMVYDEIWLFSDEGYDGSPIGPVGPPGPPTYGEPGGLTDSELLAITKFMQAGGGVFATGDHDGLGSAVGGRIPRVRFMRKWYSPDDTSPGKPPLAVTNWPGGGQQRRDTLQKGATDTGEMNGAPIYFFDDQSDDIPQPLNVLVPSHPVVQGATGVLKVYPDHMHEGEVIAPTPPSPMLTQTSTTDNTLSFAGADFTEFPTINLYQEAPIILAQDTAGQTPHVTVVSEGMVCENKNFTADNSTCVTATNNALAAYDGHTVNVGRIVTDSSFHHFLDLNLLGDPCGDIAAKQQGFNGSPSGKAYLKEFEAFYINLATWLAWKDRKFYFGFGKNNYGRDEVADNPNYPVAFYLFLEGFTPNVVGASPTITFSGSFKTNIPGLVISGPTGPNAVTYELGNTGANANVSQRIRYEFEVQFSSASLGSFPPPGSTGPNTYTLSAAIDIQGQAFPSLPAEFFLLGGDDPYFSNVNSSAGNQPYLSQDLRVFTITPTGNGQKPIGDVAFNFTTGGSPTTFDHPAAYAYIQGLITWLNQNYGYLNPNSGYTPPDTNLSDPLDTVLGPYEGPLNGDSSVTPNTGSNKNYNFAIARVRLNGSSGPLAAAQNVKVFFRMFTTQTFDTDFINSVATSADPQVTYPSDGSLTDPTFPRPGTYNGAINGCSLPFFATANYDDNPTDYNLTGPNNSNNQTIQIPHGDYTWAFYGCYLNVNDKTNEYGDPQHEPVQFWLAGSAHNCLVAQIAYTDAPIINAGGVIENPENSDKLAQRNLQVTTSGNPGFPATHRVPQTIDVRPSPPAQSTDRFSLLSYPDEIMIDWGRTPVGSVASIYWPAVDAASVLQLAARLYPAHTLSAADANTIQFKVVSPVTYIPIPAGTGGSFAGLLTVDLPASVRLGDEFDIVVRRLTTKQVIAPTPPRIALRTVGADAAVKDQALWRYSTGSFLARIPVRRESTILPVDENLLAILKWRLGQIGPGNRWYPVLLRYINYLTGRIDGMGGNASQIPPSPDGYQPSSAGPVKHAGERCYIGKVIGIRYDRFGDFEGFTLLSEEGKEHRFLGREPKVEELVNRAWIERTLISVFVEHESDWPSSIVLLRHN
jgi:hypothetical protein